MELELAVSLGAFALLFAFLAWHRVRRAQHARFVNRLTDAVRELGSAVGGTDDAPEFDTIEGGDLVLRAGDERIRVPVGDLLDTAAETDATRRRERLRWLVEKSRARSE